MIRVRDHFPRPPAEAVTRLQTQERNQRLETRRRFPDAKITPVNIEGRLLLQRNLCGCGCGDALDFDAVWDDPKNPPPGFPVIAHRLCRGSKGDHVPENVFVDRWACNSRDAKADTSGAASVKRFTPDLSHKSDATLSAREEPGEKTRWRGSFAKKPDDYVSPLSKKARREAIERMEARRT